LGKTLFGLRLVIRIYNQRKSLSTQKGSQRKNLSKGGLLGYIRYITKNVLIMFIYACKSMVVIRIWASLREIKPMEENHTWNKNRNLAQFNQFSVISWFLTFSFIIFMLVNIIKIKVLTNSKGVEEQRKKCWYFPHFLSHVHNKNMKTFHFLSQVLFFSHRNKLKHRSSPSLIPSTKHNKKPIPNANRKCYKIKQKTTLTPTTKSTIKEHPSKTFFML